MKNLESVYPSLKEARSCVVQGEYEHAINLFSEILKSINPDDEKTPYVYFEYANAMIKNSSEYFMEEIARIGNKQGISLLERNEIECDLENSWNLLEICSRSFSILRDYKMLARTYFLQGEICLLNNEFSDAIHEYTECLAEMQKVYDENDIEYADVYLSIAASNEFMNKFDECIDALNNVIQLYKLAKVKSEDEETKDKYGGLISDLVMRTKEMEVKKMKMENITLEEEEIEDDVVIDINALKRRKGGL